MTIVEKLITKLKNELSIDDLNKFILFPIYSMIYNKISPYYITLLILLSIIIILLIVILCVIIFKY